jgi:predicted N-acetyltransferase YhbS
MVEIEMLPGAAAEDGLFVAEISDLVNRAYRVAEEGLWHDGVARTTVRETAAAMLLEELAVARENGRVVGAVLTRQIDGRIGWFGALAVDPAHSRRGIGGELVRYAERRALASGAAVMRMEVLMPSVAHPHTDLLAGWYGRLGYREVERSDLADFDAAAVPFLAVLLEVVVMEKQLDARTARPGRAGGRDHGAAARGARGWNG